MCHNMQLQECFFKWGKKANDILPSPVSALSDNSFTACLSIPGDTIYMGGGGSTTNDNFFQLQSLSVILQNHGEQFW